MLRTQKTAIVAMLLGALFATQSNARSQYPSPSEGEPRQPQQTQNRGTQQPSAPDQRGTENSPIIVKVQPTPKTQAETDQEANDRLNKAAYDRNTLILSLLLVIVAFLQFVAIGIQAVFLWRAFKAAKKSADIAEASLVKLERAFVYPKDFFVRWHWYIDREPRTYFWKIRPIYENSGNTPTVNLYTNINFALRDDPLPENFSFQLVDQSFAALIGPKSFVMGGTVFIEAADLIAIRQGIKYFYFWGVLRYNDVFEGSPEHISTFCRQIVDITGDPMNPADAGNPVNLSFDIYHRYNAAD